MEFENLDGYTMYGIKEKYAKLAKDSEEKLKLVFDEIDDIALYNQAKVLKAFQNNRISEVHFKKTTGYGITDYGREKIDDTYAEIFNTQKALVRIQFVCGTHTIATVLQALLMPNDTLLTITGRPYDTILETIGIVDNPLSLKNYGVKYDEIDLTEDNDFDIPKIVDYLKNNKVKVVHIQRSRGYSLRNALTIDKIEKVIKEIKAVDKDVIVMVDNCYGEFVEKREPTDVGADILCGSLIKNPGGGLCETGGYICGREDLINLCAIRLTCPGINAEEGATLGQNKNILQGLFMAPSTVKNAIKSAILAASMMEELGFETFPNAFEKRSDIVQVIKLESPEKLEKFMQGIQASSPVDSHVVPVASEMAGYEDKIIMAAGSFVEGATIEFGADGPMRPPYVAYMQGGLTYEATKLSICFAIQKMMEN